ncbi:type I restriction endonuclease subunit R [Prevotella histicola]|jgi:type I restriction-modification system, R subunit|uniref:type I restriction endonuclease subunit R n=1 Tax=Prevotella histicola TaxID=470565 RepID=UPI001C605073|nr:type I restriction endonuclease subunit R [Prevotella histicola]MBF1400089.1 DEAD/DEAH box helicase family protein [Prevotella histicola]MBF1402233.1 DEAD/DEAH box helicase family protein [Prevotella histicola]MBS6662691.1 DEAD/DEAH box helicase family protein [Prevotella histicola]MBW4774258.1 DEAD/DEAH box helicase family protein [Prevotella histicola]
MEPEEKARVIIDRMFEEAGWKVVDRDKYAPNMTAVAIREGLMVGNREADYLLFLNGKAVGVLEAKRIEIDINSDIVQEQARLYTRSCPKWCQAWFPNLPLPLAYVANSRDLMFYDTRKSNSEFEYCKKIHTPKEVKKLLGLEDDYVGLPMLNPKGLRACQYEAITELEKSYRNGENRALMVLATGAGKTYTACLAAYRMLAFTPMKRILFLVDRNNLGKQAETEFGTFRLTENGDPFNTIFTVNRLKSSSVPADSNVVISTIQRLFSLLKGDEITDSDDDYDEIEDKEIILPEHPNLPSDFFDMIIIDECHRSIYGNWQKVLNYFSKAKLIGLTATPVPETKAFFNNNIIVNYTLEKSIIDGVNVDCRVYRIKTQATENGGAILEGEKVKRETCYTGQVETVNNQETKNYTREELNRSIVNPAQIKLILETYRDAVYTEMFTDPQREANMDYLPKTLIFALNENHATNIVQIAREVFGHNDNRFVQKITYSAGDSNELIRQFRNDKDFRIAVTCTLVATGTDIKPLEVVMFMRDVASEPLYIQMKGRGVRTIGDEQLRNVTPNAYSKDCFYLVDAVGVTEHEKSITTPSDGATTKLMSLKELLEKITHGNVSDDYLRLLASRLSRISHKCEEKDREKFISLAHISMMDIASNIFDALEQGFLPEYINVNEPNTVRKALVCNIANYPDAREFLLILNAGFIETLMPGEDTLISKGFSQEEAQTTTSAFEAYCEEHKDEIEALRIIYNNQGEPLTYTILKDLENKLKFASSKFNTSLLWNSYAIINPQMVKHSSTKEEKEALTNIIQLVRYAFHQIERLESLYPSASQRFNLWCGQNQRPLTEEQIGVMQQVFSYIASNGYCTITEIKDNDKTQAAQLIRAFGGKNIADEALSSLSQFIIYRKIA